jgi:hypothetical protein
MQGGSADGLDSGWRFSRRLDQEAASVIRNAGGTLRPNGHNAAEPCGNVPLKEALA